MTSSLKSFHYLVVSICLLPPYLLDCQSVSFCCRFLPHLLIATGFFSLLFFLLFQCIFRQGISDKGVNRQEIQDKEIFPQGFSDKEIFRQGLPDKEVNRQEILDKGLQNDLKIKDTVVMNTLAKALAHQLAEHLKHHHDGHDHYQTA